VLTIAGIIVLILCLVLVMEAYQTITFDISNENAYGSYEMDYMTVSKQRMLALTFS